MEQLTGKIDLKLKLPACRCGSWRTDAPPAARRLAPRKAGLVLSARLQPGNWVSVSRFITRPFLRQEAGAHPPRAAGSYSPRSSSRCSPAANGPSTVESNPVPPRLFTGRPAAKLREILESRMNSWRACCIGTNFCGRDISDRPNTVAAGPGAASDRAEASRLSRAIFGSACGNACDFTVRQHRRHRICVLRIERFDAVCIAFDPEATERRAGRPSLRSTS